MSRRELLLLLAWAVIAPRTLRAQQKAMPVVGILGGGSSSAFAPFVAAFRDGLTESGYVEGRNVAIEHRWAEGNYDRLQTLAADLVGRKVDVIIAMGGTPSALAAKSATSTTPIVFLVSDPVASGLVTSLARPSGNLTGVDMFTLELVAKRLELLSELVPRAKVIALLVNPNRAQVWRVIDSTQQAGNAKGLQLEVLKAGTEAEIDAAFATALQRHIGGVVVSDPLFDSLSQQVVALAARHAVPAIYMSRKYVTDGGLISYGAIFTAANHEVGIYAGKILNGAKPADLPVQQSTNFELVVNLKTTETLGLTVPPPILARADEVIE